MLELMVAIVLFTMGFLSAYMLIDAGLNLATQGKNEIIAANLLREEIELVKGMRDSNWLTYQQWDSIVDVHDTTTSATSLTPGYYTIENRYLPQNPIILRRIDSFSGAASEIATDENSITPRLQLCLDSHRRYTHDCSGATSRSPFSSYIVVEALSSVTTGGAPVAIPSAYRIRAVVTNTERGFHTYTASTIITDWKQ